MSGVLVTGVGGPAGRAVVDQLVARGLRVLGVDCAPVGIPGVVTTRVPAATDPTFLGELTRLAVRQGVALIVPTVTEELPLLADAAAGSGELGGVPVAVGSAVAVATAHDKWATFLRLWDTNVEVPRSCLGGSTSRVLSGTTGAEFVSKPRVGRGARGVVVHRPGGVPVRFGNDDSRIVQEYLPGQEYVVNLYLARLPEHDVVQVFEKTELRDGEVGNAVSVRAAQVPDVAVLARTAAAAIGLAGPADVDIRRRVDGRAAVLEVNARFGAHSARTPAVLDALLAERLGAFR